MIQFQLSKLDLKIEVNYIKSDPTQIFNNDLLLFNGKPNFLLSDDIYDQEKSLGIEFPIDKLQSTKRIYAKTIIMIGVSGCGKTRTCYDISKQINTLYFNVNDPDFSNLICDISNSNLSKYPKTVENTREFLLYSEFHVKCLLLSRLLVYKQFNDIIPNLTPSVWFYHQMDVQTQELFQTIRNRLTKASSKYIHEIFSDNLPKLKEFKLIFDESQHLLQVLTIDYHSIKNSNIINGQYQEPRSLFSFLSRFIIQNLLNSIWCGTHIKIKNLDLFYSSASGNNEAFEQIEIFTDFNYLNFSQVKFLIEKWLKPINTKLLNKLAQNLEGRPRTLIGFFQELYNYNYNQNQSIENFERIINYEYESYISKLTLESGSNSYYSFWKSNMNNLIGNFEKSITNSHQNHIWTILLDLCIANLFGNVTCSNFNPDMDMVETGLVMIDRNGFWKCSMIEPMVLNAGMNFMATEHPNAFMNYFMDEIFSPKLPQNLTESERGNRMELIITLKILNEFWNGGMQKHLPEWTRTLNIQKPKGVIDGRKKENSPHDTFISQLNDENYNYVLLPSHFAGPDIRYSIFNFFIKTTWSQQKLPFKQIKSNRENIEPKNWYKSMKNYHDQAQKSVQGKNFVNIVIEFPFSQIILEDEKLENTLYIDLNNEMANDFFGNEFVEKYKNYIEISKLK